MKKSVLASLMLAGGAVVLWVSSRLAWLTVIADDDKAGTKTVTIHGASWSTELIAAAIMRAATAIAGLILRRTGRRIIGGLAAVVAAASSWVILQILVGGTPDAQRALAILSTNNTTSATKGAQLTAWAQITTIDVNIPPVILALIGAAIGLIGGVILAAYPGVDGPKRTQYERKQRRTAHIAAELAAEPDSGRVLWDAIDADIDPTDDAVTTGPNNGSTDGSIDESTNKSQMHHKPQ